MADAWFLHRGDVYLLSTKPAAPSGFERVENEEANMILRELRASGSRELQRAFPPSRAAARQALGPWSAEARLGRTAIYRRTRLNLSPVPMALAVTDLADLAPPEEPVEAPEKYWVEVRMVDSDGEALVDAPCRIERPDGVVVESATNSQGLLRVEDIASLGECKVTFPKLEDYVFDTYAKN